MWNLRSRGERLPASDRRRVNAEKLGYGFDENPCGVYRFAIGKDDGLVESFAELGISHVLTIDQL
jgi:hypothetical protein